MRIRFRSPTIFLRGANGGLDTKRLQYRRRFVVSFGSCSFDEPRDDLRALNLL